MIKENELRIGNWVNGTHNGFSKNVKVYEFDHVCIRHTDSETNALSLGSFTPIPLTGEILLKIEGITVEFTSDPENTGASKEYNLGAMRIYQPNEDEQVFYTCANKEMDNLILDSLHQLQNLYFALKEEELTINL